jgi:SAM-dependent methyltransferase
MPVILFAAQGEPTAAVSAVSDALSAAHPGSGRIYQIPGALHHLHENPRHEWAMFRQLVSCCAEHLLGKALEHEVLDPAQLEIGRQNRLERQRAKAQHPRHRKASLSFWRDYLEHFHRLGNIPEYWHLLDHISRLSGPLGNGAQLLDAGCGPGNFGMFMLIDEMYRRDDSVKGMRRPLRYVGMEVVHNAVAQARLNFSNLRASAAARHERRNTFMETFLTCADLNQPLPFRDQEFDRIICNLVLGYVDDPLVTLKEFMRVLAPGGRIIISSLKPYADLLEIYRNFVLRTDQPEEVAEAERLLDTTCKIKQAESDGLFRSFQPHELSMLLVMSGAAEPRISSGFGDQAYVVVAERSPYDVLTAPTQYAGLKEDNFSHNRM